MSALLDIQKQLETASQRVLQLERALRDHNGLPSIAANLDSAVRVQKKLTAQFHDAAERAGYDICSYRAFDDEDRPIAGAAFQAIADFQKLVAVVYGAINYGQKLRATVSESVARETAFDFGYAMAGSVQVVLTVRNRLDLFNEGPLDNALGIVFALAESRTPADVLAHADKLGPGPINALYRWAADNVSLGLGAEIEWRKGQLLQKSIIVQRQELSKLRRTIEDTSTETIEEITVTGRLRAADVDAMRFKIQREGLPLIKGTVEPGAIDDKHRASLPSLYTADIRKTVRTRYSTGEEEIRYHLLQLRKPPSKQE